MTVTIFNRKKRCSKCKEWKAVELFYRNKSTKSGLHEHCKVCMNTNSRSYVKKNWTEKIQPKTRGYRLKHRYGLTETQFNALYADQSGLCAICKTNLIKGTDGFTGVVVDHHHTTGVVRGLLCGLCNSGLGHFRDNPEFLLNAIEYLKKCSTPS